MNGRRSVGEKQVLLRELQGRRVPGEIRFQLEPESE